MSHEQPEKKISEGSKFGFDDSVFADGYKKVAICYKLASIYILYYIYILVGNLENYFLRILSRPNSLESLCKTNHFYYSDICYLLSSEHECWACICHFKLTFDRKKEERACLR